MSTGYINEKLGLDVWIHELRSNLNYGNYRYRTVLQRKLISLEKAKLNLNKKYISSKGD